MAYLDHTRTCPAKVADSETDSRGPDPQINRKCPLWPQAPRPMASSGGLRFGSFFGVSFNRRQDGFDEFCASPRLLFSDARVLLLDTSPGARDYIVGFYKRASCGRRSASHDRTLSP